MLFNNEKLEKFLVKLMSQPEFSSSKFLNIRINSPIQLYKRFVLFPPFRCVISLDAPTIYDIS